MQDETNPNPTFPQAPAEGASPVNSMSPTPSPTVPPQVPQGQDKSDAMTYPLGSQDTQPGVTPATIEPEEDHRTILDRIMGLFNKGKKDQPENTTTTPVDQIPTDTTPPPGQ